MQLVASRIQVGRAADELLLFPRVPQARDQAERIAERPLDVPEGSGGLSPLAPVRGKDREEQIAAVEAVAVARVHLIVGIEHAGEPVDRAAIGAEPQLLGILVDVRIPGGVDGSEGRAVEVFRLLALE